MLRSVVMCVLVLSAVFLQASMGRQEAIDLVLDSILANELNHIDVFASQSVVTGSVKTLNCTIPCPFPSNWVFFIDDHPSAQWSHPCRYLFVNTATGAYETVNRTFFPSQENVFEKISTSNITPTPLMPPVNPSPLPTTTRNPRL
jgi:hypothetical protein